MKMPVFLALLTAACAAAWQADRRTELLGAGPTPQQGHVVAAQGAVFLNARRVPAGTELRVPVRVGDVVQAGENSQAEILYFGGKTAQVRPGTHLRFTR